jgi:hypothetical protein
VSSTNTAELRKNHADGKVFLRHKAGRLDLHRNSGNIQTMTVQPPTPFRPSPRPPEQVAFDRAELGTILGLYGRMVAAGEWRDYALSFLSEMAVFSVFRRAAEHPIYRIEKRPRLRAKQGLYAVIGMDGQILKRGHDLKTVLRVLERKLIRSVD